VPPEFARFSSAFEAEAAPTIVLEPEENKGEWLDGKTGLGEKNEVGVVFLFQASCRRLRDARTREMSPHFVGMSSGMAVPSKKPPLISSGSFGWLKILIRTGARLVRGQRQASPSSACGRLFPMREICRHLKAVMNYRSPRKTRDDQFNRFLMNG
jgi:hypothetical protein